MLLFLVNSSFDNLIVYIFEVAAFPDLEVLFVTPDYLKPDLWMIFFLPVIQAAP